MEALASRLGTRFLVVTVVPNALLIAYVGLLLAAGAPARSPSLARALKVLDGLTIRQVIALLLGLLIISIATHPLQTPLIQLVEGYWWGLPFGPAIAIHATERFRQELTSVRHELEASETEESEETEQSEETDQSEWAATRSIAHARNRQYWLPTRHYNLLPTALGNTLSTGEIRAGERYGLETVFAMPRLAPLLSPPSLAELRDRRNQMDAAVRLCVAAAIATVVGIALLLQYGPWLFLTLATYLLCWMCYRAAVAGARGFCNSLAAAVDLHHLRLFDALQLERPANLKEEFTLNATLGMLFRGDDFDPEAQANLRYIKRQDSEIAANSDESAAQ